jgi:hypothetical protein
MASAEGFVRQPVEPEVIGDAELVRRCGELLVGSPVERWQLGREMAAAVRRASDRRLGPAYTSWRDGDTIYLSCLPSVGFYGLDQGTYEFVTSTDRSSLRLQAVWQSSDPIWTRVSYEEFHARVNGLIADRSGCDLDREAVILICGTRGGRFGFPVGPAANGPEPLCEWLSAPQVRRTDLGWDRHPELEYAGFGYSGFVQHPRTGQVVLHCIVQGRWRTEAITDLRDALELMLPGRVSLLFVRFGCLRVQVLLGDHTSRERALQLTCAAVGRAIVTDDFHSLPSPDPACSMSPPTQDEARVFATFLDAMGDAENPDESRLRNHEAGGWELLRDVSGSVPYDEWGSWRAHRTEASLAYYVSRLERAR